MKKLLIAAVAVLLLVVAFVGGYVFAGGGASSTASLPTASPGASPAVGAAGAPQDGKPAAEAGKTAGAAPPDAAKPNDGGAGAGAAPDKAPDKAAGSPPAAAVPVRPAQATPGRDREETRYAIEFGAFRSAENAQLFAAALAERGLPVEIVESLDAAGMTWSRVWAGAFSDRWQAEARLGGYERVAGLGGVVVSEPKGPAAAAKTDGKAEPAKSGASE